MGPINSQQQYQMNNLNSISTNMSMGNMVNINNSSVINNFGINNPYASSYPINYHANNNVNPHNIDFSSYQHGMRY